MRPMTRLVKLGITAVVVFIALAVLWIVLLGPAALILIKPR
jgi:hypothetical protein